MLDVNMKDLVEKVKDALYRTHFVFGPSDKRLHIGKNVKVWNTLFNVVSGHVYIGNNSFFGHNCMVLTGRHKWVDGKRARLSGKDEIPKKGFDINIGKGCWIASGAIILGGVSIGDHSIVAAGSVVTKDVPSGMVVAGNPARIIKSVNELSV